MTIVLEKDGSYSRVVNGKKYNVTKNDSRHREIEKEYNKQEMDKVGIPENYGAFGGGAGGGSAGGVVGSAIGTTSSNPSGYDPYEKMMEDSLRKQHAAIDASVAAQNAALGTGIGRANDTYDQAARNAYIQMMQTKKDMPQNVAALGLAGTGMSESIALQNQLNYQNNLNANELERASTVQQYYDKMAGIEADAGLQKAQLEAGTGQALAKAFLELLQNEQAMAYQRERDAASDALNQRKLDMEDFNTRMSALASLGIGTAEMANYLGISEGDLSAAMRRLNAGSGGSSGSSLDAAVLAALSGGEAKEAEGNKDVPALVNSAYRPLWIAAANGTTPVPEMAKIIRAAYNAGTLNDEGASKLLKMIGY